MPISPIKKSKIKEYIKREKAHGFVCTLLSSKRATFYLLFSEYIDLFLLKIKALNSFTWEYFYLW